VPNTKYSTSSMTSIITETKRHVDGRVERFRCRLVLRRPHVAVLRFDLDKARRVNGLLIPRGSRTYGFFWPRRPYVHYRFADLRGNLIAHRFDVVEAVRLSETGVSYLDLLLDIWVAPDGTVQIEDEDEVSEHFRRGLLSKAQRQRIGRARALLLRRHRAIAAEAARLLAEMNIPA
jgi:predicted RNA-binding protein associated with RNAse of E/G family